MLPNPPVKKKKIKNVSKWACTDELEDLTTLNAIVYIWTSVSPCFSIPNPEESETIEFEDDTFIEVNNEGKIITPLSN